MVTNLFEAYDEESQKLLQGLKFLDFDEIQNKSNKGINDFYTQNNVQEQERGQFNKPRYTNPFIEAQRPSDGSFLKLDIPLSIIDDDVSYTIRIEKLENGSQVLNAYNKAIPKDKEIIFYCETTNPTKSNLFKTFVLVKYGAKYKNLLYDLKEKKAPVIISRRENKTTGVKIVSYDDEVTDNYNIIKNNGINVELETIKFVMQNELRVTSFISKTVSELFSWYNGGVSYAVDGINGWLESVKFSREDYLPKNDKETNKSVLESAVKGIDYLIPDELEKFVANTFDTVLSQITEFAKENLPQTWVIFLKKIYNTIEETLNLFKQGIKKISSLVGEAFLLGRALLMGFVNGLVSTVQMLLSLIGWLLKTNGYKTLTGESYKDLNNSLEFIEDFLDLISEKASDFFSGVLTLINDLSLEKIKDTLGVFVDKLKEYTIYDYAFFAGAFTFEVVLGVVLAIFTGGASLIAEATNATEKAMTAFRLVIREVASTATMGLVDVLQLFKILIAKFVQACKNGWKGFKQFLENLFSNKVDDVIVDEGKVLDEVETALEGLSNSEIDWMATRKSGNLGGKILTSSQIRKLRGLLKQKGIILIIENDVKSIKKLFKPIGGFEKWEDLFFYMRNQKPPYVGLFQANTKQFFLTAEATEIVAFHEMAHLKHLEEIGEAVYLTLSKLDKEMYVWKQIFENRIRWTKAELDDALGYINRIREDEYGLKPLNIKL